VVDTRGLFWGFGPLAPSPLYPFQSLQGTLWSNFVSLQSFFSNILGFLPVLKA
jgi:hypothetical protein